MQEVWLVRHGETEWAISGQHTGRTDIPLTDSGRDEARNLQRRLPRKAFVCVLTSPLQRARETCELAGLGDLARVDPDLVEWDYGDYEGRRTVDIRSERPGWRLFDDGCPGGETVDDVAVRADRVIERARGCAGNVLLFSHRDLLRVLAARWIRLSGTEGRRLALDTSAVSILGYDRDLESPVVRLWNGS